MFLKELFPSIHRETMMLVNICGALAYALMYPWIPAEPDKEMQDPSSPSPTVSQSPAGGKKGGKPAPPAASPTKGKAPAPSTQVTISPEAMPDLKKAIEVRMRSHLYILRIFHHLQYVYMYF